MKVNKGIIKLIAISSIIIIGCIYAMHLISDFEQKKMYVEGYKAGYTQGQQDYIDSAKKRNQEFINRMNDYLDSTINK